MNQPEDSHTSVLRDLIIPSYGWALDRFNALDARIQNWLMFSATVSVGVPLIVEATDADPIYASKALAGAAGLFLYQVILAARALQIPVRLLDPGKVRAELEDSPESFEGELLDGAAQHYELNRARIKTKSNCLVSMYSSLAFEALLFAAWLWYG